MPSAKSLPKIRFRIGPRPVRGGLEVKLGKYRRLRLLATGKVRRFIKATIQQKRTLELVAASRRGQCTRCGACCMILLRCPFLERTRDHQYRCKIYGRHFAQCKLFPMEPRDLAEIDTECGYFFIDSEGRGKN